MGKLTSQNKPTGFYSFARIIVWLLAHTVYPVKIIHRDRLDQLCAPYILISNHDSALDPIVLAYAVKKHEVRFLAKRELMKSKFADYILRRRLHAIPVDRHASDISAMRLAVSAIKEGHVVGVFPEGTRYKAGLMDELERGVAILTLRCGVPLVPVYIQTKLRLFHVTRLIIGMPIYQEDDIHAAADKAACDHLLRRISALYVKLKQDDCK
jgi:1-acyl-sn-glycerol-3-phosphate acyltransferase